MAQLSAILGGILAELTRARVISDQLTKDLLADYEGDPVLSTLTVPRVTIGDAAVTLRFVVKDVEEAVPAKPNFTTISTDWRQNVPKIIPKLMTELKLPADDRSMVLKVMSDIPASDYAGLTAQKMQNADRGDSSAAVAATTKPILDRWNKLPNSTRKEIGTKSDFQKNLNSAVEKELDGFLKRRASAEKVRAALTSNVDVEVKQDQLNLEPGNTQEITLTLRAEDLELVASTEGEGNGNAG